jgi:hypothetical protein
MFGEINFKIPSWLGREITVASQKGEKENQYQPCILFIHHGFKVDGPL